MSTVVKGQRMPGSKRARAEAKRKAERQRNLLLYGLIGLVVLFVVALVISRPESEPKTDDIRELRAVSVTGESLPPLEGDDAAVGMTIPEVEGSTFWGSDLEISRDGNPKMLMFLAHWCSHCQAEVPIVQAWLEEQGAPRGLQLMSVSTSVDPGQGNYPPSQWLQREGWSVPAIADDAGSTVAEAFGVNGFPFFVFVDADGVVQHRASGELSIEHIEERIAEIL